MQRPCHAPICRIARAAAREAGGGAGISHRGVPHRTAHFDFGTTGPPGDIGNFRGCQQRVPSPRSSGDGTISRDRQAFLTIGARSSTHLTIARGHPTHTLLPGTRTTKLPPCRATQPAGRATTRRTQRPARPAIPKRHRHRVQDRVHGGDEPEAEPHRHDRWRTDVCQASEPTDNACCGAGRGTGGSRQRSPRRPTIAAPVSISGREPAIPERQRRSSATMPAPARHPWHPP